MDKKKRGTESTKEKLSMHHPRRSRRRTSVSAVRHVDKAIKDSNSIPLELIEEILSRLPAKSIARFHCVSKQWESMLRSPYFKELFQQTRSLVQPRLIFAIEKECQWSFFSLPQHQSPCEKSSSSLVATAKFHIKFSPDNMKIRPSDIRQFSCGYASGLIYFYGLEIEPDHYDGVPVICNPITGRYATLPYVRRFRKAFSFLGFDPITKKYKVLFMAHPYCMDHHKIVTLGSGEMRWKQKKCHLKHEIVSEGICINGVLYYLGYTYDCIQAKDYLGDTSDFYLGDKSAEEAFVIVCFDVRSEKFKFIYPEGFCQLTNYKGKLGVNYNDGYNGDAVEFRLWVQEDVKKQEWSNYFYTLKDDKFVHHYVRSVVGVTAGGEFVLSLGNYRSKQPFCVFYFNPERNTLRHVEIQGLGELDNPNRVRVFVDDCSRFYHFADHVEYLNVNDPKLLKSNIYEVPYDYDTSETEEDEDE